MLGKCHQRTDVLQVDIHSDPSKMYATCNGMLPLVTEDNQSTAELLRLAWDGVGKYWDTEDVLLLPPPINPA